jgi:signal transduction histidine kinase
MGEIDVADQGSGISKDRFHEALSTFEQLDDQLTKKHGGIGYGPAVCGWCYAR